MVCLSHAAWALWFLGYPDEALKRNQRALTLAQKVSHPYSLVTASDFAAWLFQICRYPRAVEEQADAAIALSTEHNFGFYGPMGVILRGWALMQRGEIQDGIRQMREGISAFRATSAEIMLPYFFAMLAEAYGEAGQPEDGLSLLTEAQAAVDSTRERWWEAEIHRLKGELTLKLSATAGISEANFAEECYRQALTVARAQGAKSLVLRATMSLSRLWQQQGRPEDARNALDGIYSSFTEGFETPDLLEAKSLLQQLSS
jgi:predicted ATPase